MKMIIHVQKLISPFLKPYLNKDMYKEKKAAYTIIFLFFILVYSVITFIVTVIYNDDVMRSIMEFSVWIFLVPLILWLIRSGRLEMSINVFMILGILKGITLFDTPMGIQLFTQMSLVSLTLAAVSIKRYQLYTGSAAAYILFIIRSFYNLNREIYSSVNSIINYRLAVFITFLLYLVTIHYLSSIVDREIEKSGEMKYMMNTDTLTNIPNRFAFNSYIATMDSKKAYCLMILDLDYFKRINDTYGHLIGDKVLVQIAEMLKNNLRQEDQLFRIGGEEFCVILENITKENGLAVANQLCGLIGSTSLSIAELVTVSIGVAYIDKRWSKTQFDQYFAKADKALYKAKESGRNRVMVK